MPSAVGAPPPFAQGEPSQILTARVSALSATVHWCFDRHLISLTDDCWLLVAHNRIPASLQLTFRGHVEPIWPMRDPAFTSRPGYCARHRERFVAHRPGRLGKCDLPPAYPPCCCGAPNAELFSVRHAQERQWRQIPNV